MTSSTPIRKSSTSEQQVASTTTHRSSVGKPTTLINHNNTDTQSSTKTSSVDDNMLPSVSSSHISTQSANKIEEIVIDNNKTRIIPIIHEYRSPTVPANTNEFRSALMRQQSPSRLISSTSYTMSPPFAGIPLVVGTIPSSSSSSTMIISPTHDRSFYICKELLMTERTYRKDMGVIAESFRREIMLVLNQQQDLYMDEEYNFENETLIHLSDILFTHLLPIYKFHLHFLRQLEQRMAI
ncbi:unnamed protein product, partial [Rotaria magnacalcarata]